MAWELDFLGRFRRSIESADAVFFASIANQQDIQVLISAQMTDLYFSYRATEALNGILMIGVSTAVLMWTFQDAIQKMIRARREQGARS
jgi:hypothetical protein